MLYPYAAQMIGDLLQKAGGPRLFLPPFNFRELLRKKTRAPQKSRRPSAADQAMIAHGRRRSIARVLRGAALALALAAPAAAAGQATQRSAILFDAPSEKSRPLLILSEGFPLREISRVSGWTKVETFEGDSGWVRREKLIDRQACVVLREARRCASIPTKKRGRFLSRGAA